MFMNQHTAFTGMLAAKAKAKEAQIFRSGFIRKDCFQVKSNLLIVDNLVFHF
jgi:hypothetical protein